MTSFKKNVPLAPYTYIKIGGPAEHFALANNQAELRDFIIFGLKSHLPITVLGSASNVLIADSGIPGLVIINRAQNLKIISQDPDPVVEADSGTLMSQLVNYCVTANLANLEEFLGIPGTVGGAIFNNSHHLDHLIGDYVQSVTVINQKGEIETLSQPDCHFAYDASVFQNHHAYILSARFQCVINSDIALLKAKAQAALMRRKKSQPLELPNSGCMFKNISPQLAARHHLPNNITAAGWLVDQSGCKGWRQGGAMVSQKHANFIVNDKNATAQDVTILSNRVKAQVKKRFNIDLQREIFFLGDHPDLAV
jgi:UDP-N-acetylmuramate dehydrogenase